MRSPSLDFALRAILWMSKFAPGELIFVSPKKTNLARDGRKKSRHNHDSLPVPRVPWKAVPDLSATLWAI